MDGIGAVKRPSVLVEAEGLVGGDRMKDYGHPFVQCEMYGKVWADMLKLDRPIPPKTVALMLSAMKLCREMIRPKHDNLVDAAGYLLCAELIGEYRTPMSQAQTPVERGEPQHTPEWIARHPPSEVKR